MSERILIHYSSELPLIFFVDEFPVVLGALLSNHIENGVEQ